MNTPLLETRQLALQRGRSTILRDLDWHVNSGEVVMLIGPNGAGKSTLLAALTGDLSPAAGEIRLAGRPLPRWPAADLARHRTLLRQHSSLTLEFTAQEVVQLGGMPRRCPANRLSALVQQMMVLAGVEHLAHCPVPSLSGGEQARVHLARVLTQLWPEPDNDEPRLLLLDEPCASLDPYYQHLVCRVIREFASQTHCGVIMTMHDMNLALQYADRILALHGGRKLADGSARDVLSPGLIRQCFQVDASLWQHQQHGVLATMAWQQEADKPLTAGAVSGQ